ncbi:Zinc finger protein CONSTANS-LIKE [Musa troglodytarum]|uniref:Zinc finger protein CONSTANS-LIKE n=1 Tax=Musa troglodytarum TaxID=320322 RepID=A0A9E7JN25_9LILI|nr:Zinc finger protein CONSTANS-LIKE [Musa troglodytarum]
MAPSTATAVSPFCSSEKDESGAAPWILTEAAAPDLLFFPDADPYLDLDYAASTDEIKTVGAPNPPSLLASHGHIDLDVADTKPYTDQSLSHSVIQSHAAVVPDLSQPSLGMRAADPTLAARVHREAKVMHYREKRKNRRFKKTIRYASRKAYAQARPRIKGRFVKQSEEEDEVGRIYSFAVETEAMAVLMAEDDDYGVVPSF